MNSPTSFIILTIILLVLFKYMCDFTNFENTNDIESIITNIWFKIFIAIFVTILGMIAVILALIEYYNN